jgi:hypothetical protein
MLEVTLLIPPLGGSLTLHLLLSIFNLLCSSCLCSNSLRVLPVLILTCEDPLHAVLQLSLHIA